MTKLRYLNCSHCALFDPSSVASCTKLGTLLLDNNAIEDVKLIRLALKKLCKLKEINLSANPFQTSERNKARDLYFIMILDTVPSTLNCVDYRYVYPSDYERLSHLKSEIEAEQLVSAMSTQTADKISSMTRTHENLAARHRLEENLLYSAIQAGSKRETEELQACISFVKTRVHDKKIKNDGVLTAQDVTDITKELALEMGVPLGHDLLPSARRPSGDRGIHSQSTSPSPKRGRSRSHSSRRRYQGSRSTSHSRSLSSSSSRSRRTTSTTTSSRRSSRSRSPRSDQSASDRPEQLSPRPGSGDSRSSRRSSRSRSPRSDQSALGAIELS